MDKKKILVLDKPGSWDRLKPLLEAKLSCEINMVHEARLAKDALCSNGSYSCIIADICIPENGIHPIQARVNFIKELNGYPPVIILSKIGENFLERRCKLVLSRDYQYHVFKRTGYEKKLLEKSEALLLNFDTSSQN